MKALVTGGAGFIGSNLTKELVDRGHDVVVLDDLFLGSEENLKEVQNDIEFIQGSVDNRADLEKAIDEDVDVVFHQGARSSSPHHKDEPVKGLEVNVRGFLKAMLVAEEKGVDKIIYASTSSMYGSVDTPHYRGKGEEATNLYSASKLSREAYAMAFSKTHDLDTVGLRYFSVYGENEKQKGRYANLISQFTWKLLDDEAPVIWGDGTQTRDFTYVGDIVQANILAWKKDVDQEVYDIGTGTETSLNEMVEMLKEEIGKDIEPEYEEIPLDNYVTGTRADITKAKEELGYKPKVSIEEGIKKTVKYYKRDTVEQD